MTAKATNQENLLSTAIKAERGTTGFSVPKSALQPVWDKHLCSRCALCYIYCPDGAVSRQGDGYFNADMDLCSGCGICQRECWFGSISMQEED